MTEKIIFFDLEISRKSKAIVDIGAVKTDTKFVLKSELHTKKVYDLINFFQDSQYLCGHNIINFDLKFLEAKVKNISDKYIIDTLFLSPLLFPKKPYHHLVKDDKLVLNELNNPVNDSKKSMDLLNDEINAFNELDPKLQEIYYQLLGTKTEFLGFFKFIKYNSNNQELLTLIKECFDGKICKNAHIERVIKKYPIQLSYALSLINVIETGSITPPWLIKKYSVVEDILRYLRNKSCEKCPYCESNMDETEALKKYFHYDSFRKYEGNDLQKNAVKAAINGESLIAVFPTGGGKSVTFQLPALMAGDNERGLTVVISPLQSLMKDQTDNLEKKHNINSAVTINGSLDPIERSKVIDRVRDGSASLLYIAPESLRSKTIEKLLMGRNIVRIVIDEAHCFSSWGQDFRVEYLYIGEFIKKLSINKKRSIPVSCFTATAKQQVIMDIQKYFYDKLNLELKVFEAGVERKNLSYHIINENKKTKDEKYDDLLGLIKKYNCPTIVYVFKTKEAEDLAEKLRGDHIKSCYYHGRMDRKERIKSQEAFMKGEINVIVATTAFGMGVDKSDVQLVIHYNISDSLENYIQESGRAGRDECLNAECYILFNEDDINERFSMLNSHKISYNEIQQVWKAIIELTKTQSEISQSALEIAKKSGWDISQPEIETKVKTAINALEQANFIKRGLNSPKIFADSIMANSTDEIFNKIDTSPRFIKNKINAKKIAYSLIMNKKAQDEGESRVDYLADNLGISIGDTIEIINLLREENIISDEKDLIVQIERNKNDTISIVELYYEIGKRFFNSIDTKNRRYNIKEINEEIEEALQRATINEFKSFKSYCDINNWIKVTKATEDGFEFIQAKCAPEKLKEKIVNYRYLAKIIINYIYALHKQQINEEYKNNLVNFSLIEIKNEINRHFSEKEINVKEVQEVLYYLIKIEAIKMEGGFLVIYNKLQIERLKNNNKIQFQKKDYIKLDEYYQNKREQIHIVCEFAQKMINNYNDALKFVNDYFSMDNSLFIKKYFKGREEEIKNTLTPKRFQQLFGDLSAEQLNVVKDVESDYIVVKAGPGSGKTKLLVHKLASIYELEGIPKEQMLMLTYSRAAATEFKQRLIKLIGTAGKYIQVTTFHSFCFDLLGKVGNIEKSSNIVSEAIKRIKENKEDIPKLATKRILIIDEAQDIDKDSYELIRTIIDKNENLKIVAVGDDDQNIYGFRGSSSEYFVNLKKAKPTFYELTTNYRSARKIVDFSNIFINQIDDRLKKTPSISNRDIDGKVEITKYRSALIDPVVEKIQKMQLVGSTCVITFRNEDVMSIIGLLTHYNIKAKQIKSTKNFEFDLNQLLEMRAFIDYIDEDKDAAAISNARWEESKQRLNKEFNESPNLANVNSLISAYEKIALNTKYKSDFIQFVHESDIDDFLSISNDTIFVSTIFQAKGREFNNVFLVLPDRGPIVYDNIKKEDKIRMIFVGISRAKNNLYILYNQGSLLQQIFNNRKIGDRIDDMRYYSDPHKICFELALEDIEKKDFICCQEYVSKLKTGQSVKCYKNGFYLGPNVYISFSQTFKEKLEKKYKNDYIISLGKIKYIIYWYYRKNDSELKIVLPYIELIKDI